MTDIDAFLFAEKEAHEALIKTGRAELGATLAGLFESNPDLENIVWGHKYSEYNDEGMYPGITGPKANADLGDELHVWDVLDDMGAWGSTSDPAGKFDKEVRVLSTLLNKLGEENLAEIIGGDEALIIVERTEDGSIQTSCYDCCF